MAGDGPLTIGELARLAGLPAKTIRYWSDEGLVPPAARTPAGYRLYGPDAMARLGLVRALRDLGVGLAGIDLSPDFETMMRGAMPDLPQEPSREQIDAWVELAELAQDPAFRARLRQTARTYAQARTALAEEPGAEASQAMAALLRDKAGAAIAAGLDPGSAQAQPIADELAAAYARHFGRADGPEFRAWLLEQLESGADRRYERYWQLLAVINGWPTQPAVTLAAEWLIAALRSVSQSPDRSG